jgi:hypothetical protein
MKTLLTTRQKYNLVDNFIDLVSSSSANIYMGIGRVNEWSSGDVTIPYPDESTDGTNSVFRTLIAMKKITAGSLSPVVRRRDWTYGTVYDAFDNTVDMFSTVSVTSSSKTVNALSSRTVTGNAFTSYFAVGDIIRLLGNDTTISIQDKEVVEITNANTLVVNTAFTSNYVTNTAYKVTDTFPYYAKNFYVRNSKDQVFKCLFNDANSASYIMPEISIGGQLPESVYVETSDGYKWKYLYTIDSSSKRKFFTSDWMPVSKNQFVVDAAVDGSIDIVKIVSGGNGYNSGVATSNAAILSVTGDGSGANLSAKVDSTGRIYDINVLNGGSGYTKANVTATGGDATASFIPVIGPKYGHGYNPIVELGAAHLAISIDLDKDESGTIPTQGIAEVFDYHQISLVKDPLTSTGAAASNTNYRLTYAISTSPSPNFALDETVYQGATLSTSTFSASVVYWDSVNSVIYVNNLTGTFAENQAIRGTVQTTAVTAFEISEPQVRKYTGEILYINNTAGITRDPNQAEQLKLTLSFK